jgi:hypothetical protein
MVKQTPLIPVTTRFASVTQADENLAATLTYGLSAIPLSRFYFNAKVCQIIGRSDIKGEK